MKRLLIIGLISIFATCNKSVTVQLRCYDGDKPVIGTWSQVSGPSQLVFNTTHDSVVTITGTKPAPGTYVIKVVYNGKTAISTGTVK